MTRLIVISSEQDIRHETALVNTLFENGMELFHLRKPHWTMEQQRDFFEQLDLKFHSKISIHQYHQMAEELGLKYLHFSEELRGKNKSTGKAQVAHSKSTSFHSYESILKEDEGFDYCFLSPVFDSVSKKNYRQNIDTGLKIGPEVKTKVFALGGITSKNIESVFERGFYGAAVLGNIWNDPEKSLQHFTELYHLCTGSVHTY